MPAKRNAVMTPLHLLQQLSKSLVVHLEKACTDAQKDAEILLAKLEKQRGKTQEKLIKARAKLDEAGNAGKSKAQTKARSRLAELDDMLTVLQSRQSETLTYLSDLKRDAEHSLTLAQGISQVEKAAGEALASRGKTTTSRSASATRKTASASKPAPARQAGVKPNPAPAKSPANRASNTKEQNPSTAKAPTAQPASGNTTSRPTSRGKNPAAKPSRASKPATARKPAATRKPAAKAGDDNQPSPGASS